MAQPELEEGVNFNGHSSTMAKAHWSVDRIESEASSMYRKQFSLGWSVVLAIAVVLMLASGAWAASKYKVVYDFGLYKHGYRRLGNLALDSKGNFYGGTLGESSCCGMGIYELTPSSKETGLPFKCGNLLCGTPNGDMIFDREENLYGTAGLLYFTEYGYEPGDVFELKRSGGRWSVLQLYKFQGINSQGGCASGGDGCAPQGGLVP